MIDAMNETQKGELKGFVELIERLINERTDISDRIKDAYHEADSKGYGQKEIKEVIKARKGDIEAYKHSQGIIEHYLDIAEGK